jgi:hypothetical protein
MTDPVEPTPPTKKTPANATPFEREQLSYFLSDGDLAATLLEVNPSLAWLPFLAEKKLIQNETQLIAWIERNFGDPDAVREVVASIDFFGPETAGFLEYRLNAQAADLPSVLVRSWTLIIRHMRAAKQGLSRNEWFDVLPHLKRCDFSIPVLERLANVLRPHLKVEKVLSSTEQVNAPQRPSDLMSIHYKVRGHVSAGDVLAVWPDNAAPETDRILLLALTSALEAALADATDAGVEGNEAYSISDVDVPSVARHTQNEYRSGFQVIVRVMAEVWARLAGKSPETAIGIAERWRDTPYRLMWRLAMFSFADPSVPAKIGADMLITVTAGELFLPGSSVEAYRLIRARWNDFPAQKQRKIIRRLCEGPPPSRLRDGAEIDRYIDRRRFDVLSEMVRDGFEVGQKAKELLAEIQRRWPEWQPRPSEQARFHIWHAESDPRQRGDDSRKLAGVRDEELVAEARKIAAAAGFMDGDAWQDLCLSDPDRALRGLDIAAANGDWPPKYWKQLLRSTAAYSDVGTNVRVAELLLRWQRDSFGEIAGTASSWLDGHAKNMPDDLFWPLWDRIADTTLIDEPVEVSDA